MSFLNPTSLFLPANAVASSGLISIKQAANPLAPDALLFPCAGGKSTYSASSPSDLSSAGMIVDIRTPWSGSSLFFGEHWLSGAREEADRLNFKDAAEDELSDDVIDRLREVMRMPEAMEQRILFKLEEQGIRVDHSRKTLRIPQDMEERILDRLQDRGIPADVIDRLREAVRMPEDMEQRILFKLEEQGVPVDHLRSAEAGPLAKVIQLYRITRDDEVIDQLREELRMPQDMEERVLDRLQEKGVPADVIARLRADKDTEDKS